MRKDTLKDIVASIKAELPEFNHELLRETRQNMIAGIPKELEKILMYLVVKEFPYVEYRGYKQVGARELADYTSKAKYSNVNIQDSNVMLLKYSFYIKVDGVSHECPLYVFVPYLFEEEFTLKGTSYFPIFTIMDKSIVRVKNKKGSVYNYMGIKVPFILSEVLFQFNEKCKFFFVDTKERKYEATVMKVKAHHKVKAKDTPPALLYIFAKYGLETTLAYLGYTEEDVKFVSEEIESDQYTFFKFSDTLFLRVPSNFDTDIHKKRLIGALIKLLHATAIPSLENLYDPESLYFKFLLGKWIQKIDASLLQQINQATEHLKTIDRMVDYRGRENLAMDGIEITDFYDLTRYLFFHMDGLLEYKTNNLFQKKISITPQLLYGFIKTLSSALFSKTQAGEPMKPEVLTGIFRKVTKLLVKNVERMNGIFMTHNDQSNDNWLLGIGGKKSRQEGLRDPFSSDKDSGKAPDGGLKSDMSILAHYSQLYIESILNLPASNPCKGGTINPFFRGISKTGLFEEPVGCEQHKDIFHTNNNWEE